MPVPPTPTSLISSTTGQRFAAVLCLAALLFAFWRAPTPAPSVFSGSTAAPDSSASAMLQSAMLPGVPGRPGAPSLTRLPDGRIAAVWPSAAEGARQQDVIWFSLFARGRWQEALPVITGEEVAGEQFAHLKNLGEVALTADDDGLRLWFNASGAGGQHVLQLRSEDGEDWHALRRLATSPTAIRIQLAIHPPLPLQDGGVVLPLHAADHTLWVRLDAEGKARDRVYQPALAAASALSVVALDATQLLALFIADTSGELHTLRSSNGGQDWQDASTTGIRLSGERIALLRLSDGRLLLAANPESGSNTLALWLGDSEGRQWQGPRVIETAQDALADFSAPSLSSDAQGRIHLVYRWREQSLRHFMFTPAWLETANP